MKRSRIIFAIIAFAFLCAFFLTGCSAAKALNYKKIESSIFATGDYVCLPMEDGDSVTILGLTDTGKEKTMLIIPETINGKKVVSLGGWVYGGSLTVKNEDRFRVFQSDNLKKLYIPFEMTTQYRIYESDSDKVDYIVDIPNALIVSADESTAIQYAEHGYSCKGVVLSSDRIERHRENGAANVDKYVEANVVYCDCDNTNNARTVLWADYLDEGYPIGYTPTFPDKEEQKLIYWCTDQDKKEKWNGALTAGLTLYAQYGYTDGVVWGTTGDYFSGIFIRDHGILIRGFVSPATAPLVCTIPETIGGVDVVGIWYDAFNNEKIREVTIPDSVTDIIHAFCGCPFLKKVNFGANSRCESIKGSFNDCIALTEFSAPSMLRSFLDSFAGCASLASVNVNNAGVDRSFYNCPALKTIACAEGSESFYVDDGVALYSIDSIYNIKSLILYAGGAERTSYTISSDCTVVSEKAFMGAANLQSIGGGGFIKIEESAFENCAALKTVKLNNNQIGRRAFYGCSALESVVLEGEGLTTLRDCFAGTPDSCVFYVLPDKVEWYTSGADVYGITGTVTAIE